jgi:hypothetical protein
MKISADIQEFAQAGMQEKAREFRDAGGELYWRNPRRAEAR